MASYRKLETLHLEILDFLRATSQLMPGPKLVPAFLFE